MLTHSVRDFIYMKIKKKCLICGDEFEIYPYKIKKGIGICCSPKCQHKWQSKYRRGKNNPFYNKHHSEISKIKISESNKGRKTKPFSKEHKEKIGLAFIGRTGKNHPAWKGDKCISPMRKRIWQSIKYQQWRQDIFIRDNFICQKCNQKGGDLEVHHHKKSFKNLLKEVKKYLPLLSLYEGAMIYSPLWDIKNGITLCKKCHNKTKRRVYGKR